MRKNTKILVETWRRFLNESTIDRIFKSVQDLHSHNESKENKGVIQLIDKNDEIKIKYLGFDEIEGEIKCEDISESAGYDEVVLANGRPVWQVSNASASKSWGPLLYDICIEYISNTKGGALMSDRNQVKEDAENVWEKYQNRSDVKKVQMDFGELGSNSDPDANSFILSRDRLPGHLGIEKDESLSEPYSINYTTPGGDNFYQPISQYSPNNTSDDVNQYSTFANLIKKSFNMSKKQEMSEEDQAEEVYKAFDDWINSPLSKAYYKESLDVITKLKSLNLYIEE